MEQVQKLEEQIRDAVQAPDPNPEFAANLRLRLARLNPAPERPRFGLRPAWAAAIVLAVLVIAASLPGAASAVRQLLRYLPGIGLVDGNTPQKVLEAPVSVTRGGVTLTLEQVIAYHDRVELAYRVDGLPAAGEPAGETACSGADMYPTLDLPDGTQIAAEPVALGGEQLAGGYTAGHAFAAPITAEGSAATFYLKCLQAAQPGAAPENWAIPFALVSAAPDQPVGEALQPGGAPVVVEPAAVDASYTFLGGAAKETGYHFFFRFSVADSAPDFLAARPAAMYLIDSSGARIELINALPWSPFDTVDVWEYRAVADPAPGPLAIYIDGVAMYYNGQAASFQFTPNKDAQVGQAWELDERFTIGGYDLAVTEAEMVEMQDRLGFEFTVTADQPGVTFSAELIDMHADDQRYEMWSITNRPVPARTIKTGFVYETGAPETLRATFNTIEVPVRGTWSVAWTPPQP